MTYRLVIFDFDGTLADSFPWFVTVMNEVADRFGIRHVRPEEIEGLRHLSARQIMARLEIPMWKLPAIATHVRRRMTAELGAIPLFPGVDALLPALKARGVRIAVVTSNSAENVQKVMGPELSALVDHWGCGAGVFGKRVKLRKAVAAMGVRPEEALCVGDELRDLEAARGEGLAFGAVTWGYTAAPALRAAAPTRLFEQVGEIAEVAP